MVLDLSAGLVVGARYRLERRLGRGGMGEVWSAEQLITRKRVALKFLTAGTGDDAETRHRFLREARAACAVSHPNVVQVHDVIELEGEVPALVMELLKGESLEAKLQRDGKLPIEEALAIMLRVVSAVGTAHTLGIVHRDLKPDNIFLAETPEGVDVKVLDFGIAKFATTDAGAATAELTATGATLGTPFYMSPEQAFGEKRVDHRADIWSLGIVLFRCLSGELPTRADNLGQILKIIMVRSIPRLADAAPEVPKPVAALVDKMLSYEPADRPSDLREVKAALEAFLHVRVTDFGAPAIDASSLAGVSSPLPGRPVDRRVDHGRRPLPSGAIALAAATLLGAVTAGVVMLREDAAGRAASSGRPAAGSAELADVMASAPSAAVSAEPVPSDVSVTPATAVPQPATSIRRPSTGAAPSTRPSAGPAAVAPSATSSSGWGGIVEEPGF